MRLLGGVTIIRQAVTANVVDVDHQLLKNGRIVLRHLSFDLHDRVPRPISGDAVITAVVDGGVERLAVMLFCLAYDVLLGGKSSLRGPHLGYVASELILVFNRNALTASIHQQNAELLLDDLIRAECGGPLEVVTVRKFRALAEGVQAVGGS